MVSTAIVPGALAFLWPAHIPALPDFRYVRVTSVQGSKAKVALVSLDGDDEALDEEVDIAVLQRRRVGDEEGELWPGTFIGHPIAFIMPDGPSLDEWAFGVVSGYRMAGGHPSLHVRGDGVPVKLKLEQPPNVIKVNWVNYVLQTGAGENASAVNAEEMVVLMDEVSAQCGKSRAGLPAKIAKSLSVPFDAEAPVPIIRPDTLAVITAPRKHALDGALNKKGKKGTSMFNTQDI